MKILYITAIYPSGTTVEHELGQWDFLMRATVANDMAEIWLCEGQDEEHVGCDVSADRIMVWQR